MDKFIPELGKRLKSARENSGFCMQGFTSEIKEKFKNIGQYENGTQIPDFETTALLACLYNVTLEYLAGIEKQESVVVNGLDKMQIALINLMIEMLRKNNKE